MAGPYTLTGSGQQSIATPLGLKVEVLARGNGATVGFAQPPNTFHVGLLRWGNANGFFPPVPIDADTQQLLLPPGMTTLGYQVGPGAQIRVTETKGIPRDLWDRRLADATFYSVIATPGGTSPTSTPVYSVPAGQTLYVSHLGVRTVRQSVASVVSSAENWVDIGGPWLLYCNLMGGSIGSFIEDYIRAGDLFVPGGVTINWHRDNFDTGGQVVMQCQMRGFTFQ